MNDTGKKYALAALKDKRASLSGEVAHLVAENESRLIGDAKVARHCEHALALHFIAEDRDGGEIHTHRHLARGKQSAGGNRELFSACAALETQRAGLTAELISLDGMRRAFEAVGIKLVSDDSGNATGITAEPVPMATA